jgi:hypothetical protein
VHTDSLVFFSPLACIKSESDDEYRGHNGFDVLSDTTMHANSESESTDESWFKPGSTPDSSSESEVNIDCQTTIPSDVFMRFLQAGKKARRRGQHQLHWRNRHLVCQEDQCIDLQTKVPTDVFLSFLHAGEEARRRGQHQQQMEGSSRHLVRIETSALETLAQPDTGLEGYMNQEYMGIDCSTRNSSSLSKVAQCPSNPRILGTETADQVLHMGIDCSTRNSSTCIGQVPVKDKKDRQIASLFSRGCDDRLLFLLSMVRGSCLQHKPQMAWETSRAVDLV